MGLLTCMVLLGHHFPLRYNHLLLAVYVVVAEAILTGVCGLPDFPECAFGICFLCRHDLLFESIPRFGFHTQVLGFLLYPRVGGTDDGV